MLVISRMYVLGFMDSLQIIVIVLMRVCVYMLGKICSTQDSIAAVMSLIVWTNQSPVCTLSTQA